MAETTSITTGTRGKSKVRSPFMAMRILLLAAMLTLFAPSRASTALVTIPGGEEMYLTDFGHVVQDVIDIVETDLWYEGPDGWLTDFSGSEMTVAILPRYTIEQYSWRADFCISFYGNETYYAAHWDKGVTLCGETNRGHYCPPGHPEGERIAQRDREDAYLVLTMPGFIARRADFEIFYPQNIERNLRLVEEYFCKYYSLFREAEYARITYGYYRDGTRAREPGYAAMMLAVEMDGKLYLYDCRIQSSEDGKKVYADEPRDPYPYLGEITMEGESGEVYERNMHYVNRLWEENWRVTELRYGQRVE